MHDRPRGCPDNGRREALFIGIPSARRTRSAAHCPSGRLFIPTGSTTPLTVSSRAVESIGQIQQVWVLSEENVPQRRYVRTGRIYADRVEILSGLQEGERVMVPEDASSSQS